MVDLLKEITEHKDYGIKIRILTPVEDSIRKTIHRFEKLEQVEIRYIEPALQTRVTILLVDKKFSLAVEVKDDSKQTSIEAIGLATYSNSPSTVFSYASIFETLWRQVDISEELKALNQKLRLRDTALKEFVNIAAHELRTPIQPIIGLSDILQSEIKDNKQRVLLGIITRNARTLKRLSENILDVTKIESKSLKLNKEQVDLKDIILNAIEDIVNQGLDTNVKILYEPQNIDVLADKEKITQVFFNLLNNSITFTTRGSISIITELGGGIQQVVASIRDTGKGIDPEIFPKLFSKFITKSDKGTGLGLYISKSIIEAHGGKMWANNNSDGKGATFSFTLPIIEKHSLKP